MSERNGHSHELFQFAKGYRERMQRNKIEYTKDDYLLDNQLLVIATNPPVLARPKRWQGAPYKSSLIAELGNGARIIVPLELIHQRLVVRVLNKEERRVVLRHLTPQP